MNEILGQLSQNRRLVSDVQSLLNILQQNTDKDVVLFWFHPLCPACSDMIEMWYQHGDTCGFMQAGNVLFVEFNACIQKAFRVSVLPSMTVLRSSSQDQQLNMFGTLHDVMVHCNTSFANIFERFGIRLTHE